MHIACRSDCALTWTWTKRNYQYTSLLPTTMHYMHEWGAALCLSQRQTSTVCVCSICFDVVFALSISRYFSALREAIEPLECPSNISSFSISRILTIHLYYYRLSICYIRSIWLLYTSTLIKHCQCTIIVCFNTYHRSVFMPRLFVKCLLLSILSENPLQLTVFPRLKVRA